MNVLFHAYSVSGIKKRHRSSGKNLKVSGHVSNLKNPFKCTFFQNSIFSSMDGSWCYVFFNTIVSGFDFGACINYSGLVTHVYGLYSNVFSMHFFSYTCNNVWAGTSVDLPCDDHVLEIARFSHGEFNPTKNFKRRTTFSQFCRCHGIHGFCFNDYDTAFGDFILVLTM